VAIDVQSSDDNESGSSDEKILSLARERFRLAEEAESSIRNAALEDLRFRKGDQWPEAIKADRDKDGRPCLVINRIPQFIQQVTNDQRQNRPAIKVHPVGDGADIETAKIFQGLIRHIEYNSRADVAYDTAFDSAVTGGFGYFRVVTDYVNPVSFEQEILIKRVRNPFSVYFDPASQEPDGSDAGWAQIVEELSCDEYRAKYPKSKYSSMPDWSSIGDNESEWVNKDGCRVAEYFYKEYEERELCLLQNGIVVERSQVPDGVVPSDTRTAQVPVIRWCKHNGSEILEKTDWPGIYIPIIPVYGNELFINGERVLEGIVRNARDSQRMYNYWISAETEAIALAPRAPFIAAEGQIDKAYAADWATANRRNHSVLVYKPTSIAGVAVPPPQRQAFEPAVQAITQARMLAADDLKATTGIYDAALGAKSNETSGVAIQRRNVQAQTSNFHFIDNLTRSLRHGGRVIIDLIPHIYDTARTVRIIGDEGDQRLVAINQQTEDQGQVVEYAMDAGKYDVTVDVGPSFASKRQEAVASMLEVLQGNPGLMQIAGDLFVKSMDWPGAQALADRLKKALPPGLAEDDKDKKQPIPPQVQAQMQQMSTMLEQMTGKLNELQAEREQKLLELESRERIEMKKLEVQVELKRAELDAKDSLAILNAEIGQLSQRLELLHVNQPINQEESEFATEPAGAIGAESVPPMQTPTGGESPGSPMDPEGPMQ
jgi:hypothetical protein